MRCAFCARFTFFVTLSPKQYGHKHTILPAGRKGITRNTKVVRDVSQLSFFVPALRFRSIASFLAEMKKRIAAITSTGIIIDIAQRSDSTPRAGASRSLRKPTTNGPKPRPMRFSTRNNIAELRDRIDAGTRL